MVQSLPETQPDDRGLAGLPFIGPALGRFVDPPPLVNVLRLSGVIGGLGGLRRGLTLAGLARPIERAFKGRNLKAVALAVNSPGGSPVQSALIAGRIRQLAQEKDLPVYAFAEDLAASGGYWLACAGDEIYADPSSIVGSIGVVSGGFGLTEMIAKLGIERRLHTAGDKKAMLDPFQPEKPAEVKHLKDIQGDIHLTFKDMVRQRRGERLTAPEKELFSGAFWTGGRALEMGLIDGLGDLRQVMRDKYGDTVRLRVVGERRGLLGRFDGTSGGTAAGSDVLDGPGGALGDGLTRGLIAAAEERLMWNRFGL